MASALTHPRGYQLAMPFLVLNLGIEMIYILEQRLRAQNIAPDKCRKGAAAAAVTIEWGCTHRRRLPHALVLPYAAHPALRAQS